MRKNLANIISATSLTTNLKEFTIYAEIQEIILKAVGQVAYLRLGDFNVLFHIRAGFSFNADFSILLLKSGNLNTGNCVREVRNRMDSIINFVPELTVFLKWISLQEYVENPQTMKKK